MTMLRKLHTVLLTLLLLTPLLASAVELPALFGDHMVLQQNKPIRIWGKTQPGGQVAVTLADTQVTAQADDQGRFRAQLPALSAKKHPGALKLVVKGPGGEVTFNDVLLGEVWLCSGQSNMEWPLRKSSDGKAAVAEARHADLRLFVVPRQVRAEPQFTTAGGAWQPCSPEAAADFSGVAYYFGRHLQEKLGVPVGLIQSAVGGTPIEAWMPPEAMEGHEMTQPLVDYHRELMARLDEIEAAYNEQFKAWQQAEQAGTKPSVRKPKKLFGLKPTDRVGHLYNGMIAPLAPDTLAGVIWYQGESNASRGRQYSALLPQLVGAWRTAFQQPDLPFGIVQLPNFGRPIGNPGNNSKWAELREAQLQTFQALENTGLAITIDLGEPKNIHPGNKAGVGERLAAWALADVYGQGGPPTGPVYRDMEVKDGKIRLRFDYVGGGLKARGGKLEGFAIAGPDQKFVWADAAIDGDTVIVHSDEVTAPAAVRYAWADDPAGNLFSQDGLPASPFRTDSWEVGSDGHFSHPPLP